MPLLFLLFFLSLRYFSLFSPLQSANRSVSMKYSPALLFYSHAVPVASRRHSIAHHRRLASAFFTDDSRLIQHIEHGPVRVQRLGVDILHPRQACCSLTLIYRLTPNLTKPLSERVKPEIGNSWCGNITPKLIITSLWNFCFISFLFFSVINFLSFLFYIYI